jgi:hypothetical protein
MVEAVTSKKPIPKMHNTAMSMLMIDLLMAVMLINK